MATAIRIDGKAKAAELSEKITAETAALARDHGIKPGLAVVIIGEDPASQVYVRNKQRRAAACGFHSVKHALPEDVSQEDVLALIDDLNGDDAIHGILVQLPLPGHLDEGAITQSISPAKDVDGFHAFNVGKLALRQPGLRPCTPRGVMSLLHYYGIANRSMHAVIIGASNIVGRPMALELLLTGSTVTVSHRFTRNLEDHVRSAELLISAIGKPGIIDSEWIPRGAIVVDVGINRLPDGRLVGDIDFASAAQRAGWISPVPGGVGPMTITMLMKNTVQSAKQFAGLA